MLWPKPITIWMAMAALVLGSAAPSLAQNRRENQTRTQRQNQRNQRSNNVPRPPAASQPKNNPLPPGRHAGQWLRRYRDLPPQQQQKALDNDPQFRSLPAQRQENLRNRLQRFNNLPPQQQQRILNRMETWEHLTPQQKQDARRVYSQIKDLPPERRRAMQNAINALRAMPPGARQQAIESGRFSQYSPQERQMLDGVSQLPLAPPEANQPPEQ